jgi:hypothetical protein
VLGSGGDGVDPPLAPASYPLPARATVVSSPKQLVAALSGPQKDIVLADGVYDNAAPFTDSNGSRIYAEHPGRAVLTAGLVVGGNGGSGGSVVRGLVFDVSDPSKAFGGGIVHVWGSAGANTQVLDCVFDGNGVVPVGLLAGNPSGLVAVRLVFSNFTEEGIRASDNLQVAYRAPTPLIDTISDISVAGVGEATPGSSDGTAEAGIWIGHPVKNGVRRIRIRNVSWAGIETVNNSWDTTFADLDIDMTGSKQLRGIGIYLEHDSRNLVFDGFTLTGVLAGFNAEWDNGIVGGAAAHNVTIGNGMIDARGWQGPGRTVGIYLDSGTESTDVINVTFKNQSWAGIGSFQNNGANDFRDNTFHIAADAIPVSYDHI